MSRGKVVERNEKGEATRFVGAYTNITDQKKVELELVATKQKLESIFNEMNDVVWSMSYPSLETLFVTPPVEDLYGYPLQEWMEKGSKFWKEVIFPEDLPLFDGIFERIETEGKITLLYRVKTIQGTVKWVKSNLHLITDTNGKPIRLDGQMYDMTEHKEIEIARSIVQKELEKTKNFLAETNQAARVGGWEYDPITKNVLWTDVIRQIHELPTDYIPNFEEMAAFYTPESWEILQKAIQIAMVDGTPYDLELQITTAKGKLLWVRGIGNSEFKEGKCIRLFGVFQDITVFKETELVLQESEKKFRELFENLVDEVHLWKIIKDETGKITGWQLVDANPSALKAWGKSIEQIIGKTANEIFGFDAHSQFMPIVEKIFKTGKSHKWEESFSPTNQYLFMESIPFGDQFISTGKDISDQKQVEQALKESELRFSIAIEGTEAGIWDWDMVKNQVVFSTQWKRMLGYEDAEIENSFEGWKTLWHPEDTLSIEKAVTDHMNGVTKKYEVIHRCRHKSGEWRWIMTRGKILWDNAGNPYRWIGTNVDITPQKQAEEDQKIARQQADFANKAKSEFLANMSHEIRTPLNGVIGFTDLLRNTQLSPVQQQYVNNANVSGHTLLGIINDILDFSKIEAGMLELESIKTDMVELLQNSVDIVKFSADKKDLELLLDIDPTMPRFANVDPIRIKQILANLLGNAIKFTPKGEVELKVSFSALGGEQGKLSFSVRDTGIGISDAQKAKLFKAFSQADSSTTRKFGGTGLGLIISQMIVEKMGSRIQIDSAPDAGTTFYFELTTEFEAGEKLDTTKIAKVKRCLVIDDNANNRLILEQILKQWQIESDSCDSGFEALKRLETSQPYDVILCDYNMPYMNGLETIRIIREKLKLNPEKHPVILLNISTNSDLHEKCKELGVRFCLSKPVKSQDLFDYLSYLHQSETKIVKQESLGQDLSPRDRSAEKIKILIAEDVSINMMLITTMLFQQLQNAEIFEAENGSEALELYKTNTPDLIFMDIHMPILDGLEATKSIREIETITGKHIPVIALTAGALKEERDKCYAVGMDDFVTKPIIPENIQAILNKHFPQRRKVTIDSQEIEGEREVHFGYSELLSSLGNEKEIVLQLISKVITGIPIKIEQLEQACIETDTKMIKTAAHAIKGSFLSMRCQLLAGIAGKLESDAKENYPKNLELLLTELKAEWEIVKNIMLQKMN